MTFSTKDSRLNIRWCLRGYAEKLKTLDLDSLRVEKESRTEMLFATTYGPWDFNAQPDDVIKTRGVYSASSVHRAGPVVQLQLLTVSTVTSADCLVRFRFVCSGSF